MSFARTPAILLSVALCIAPSLARAQNDSPATPSPADPSAAAPSAATPSAAAPSAADTGKSEDYWRLVMSPYTYHYSNDPDHKPVYAIGLERQRSDKWYWGATYFSNSFGQPSGYLYFGQTYDSLFSVEPLFAQWSVGLLYGYKDPYEDKVPFNVNGFSPGAVLSLGWRFTREFSTQLNFLGTAALQFQLSIDFR